VSTLLLLLAGAVLGLGLSLRLDPPMPPPSRHLAPWMSRLDADGSGAISRNEYVQISDGLISFDIVDRSGDGAIDTRELEVFLRTVDPMWTFSEPD
jgi:Ca2+-binding EF-hand superfamily protein